MLIEAVGIVGGVLLLGAFLMVSAGTWNGRSFWYEVSNFFGCVLLVIYTLNKQAYTNIALNIIWGLVALFAIIKIVSRHKFRKNN